MVEVDWVMTLLRAVKILPTLREVVVALVPVALVKVRVVTFPLVEDRSVAVAAVKLAPVANRLVAVALVVVLLPIDRYCSVDEAREIVPRVKVCSWFQVFAEVVAG